MCKGVVCGEVGEPLLSVVSKDWFINLNSRFPHVLLFCDPQFLFQL